MAAHNVTVNNLLSGAMATVRIRELGETADRLIAKVPVGRAGQPKEFGAACAFPCNRQVACIIGQNLLIDAGLYAFAV